MGTGQTRPDITEMFNSHVFSSGFTVTHADHNKKNSVTMATVIIINFRQP